MLNFPFVGNERVPDSAGGISPPDFGFHFFGFDVVGVPEGVSDVGEVAVE